MGDEHTPHEMAEQDEAAGQRMREFQHADESLAHGFDATAQTLATLGYDQAAENVQVSADSARHAGVAAKYSAEAYEGAAKSWTEVEHDLSEQARLTGEMYAATATAAGGPPGRHRRPRPHRRAADGARGRRRHRGSRRPCVPRPGGRDGQGGLRRHAARAGARGERAPGRSGERPDPALASRGAPDDAQGAAGPSRPW